MKIRSHAERVKKANEYVKKFRAEGKSINIFDREAIVEYLLLEDLCNYAKDNVVEMRAIVEGKGKKLSSKGGRLAASTKAREYAALAKGLQTLTEVVYLKIQNGEYSSVWKMIPEHILMKMARSQKYLMQFIAIVTDMLKESKNDMQFAEFGYQKVDEEIDRIEAEIKNMDEINSVGGLENVLDPLFDPESDENKAFINALDDNVPANTENIVRDIESALSELLKLGDKKKNNSGDNLA